MFESTSIMVVLEWSPLNPIEEERLRNKCWLEVVDERYNGRVYEIGYVDSHYESVEVSCSRHKHVPVSKLNLKRPLHHFLL